MGIKVSVVIPVFNVEKYLQTCLDSVVNQTLKEIEIICVDDGSTDNSAKILDEYANVDERIHVIHKKNTGYGNSMNVGLSQTSGEYVAIIESDDFVELNMLEKLYNAAKESTAEVVKAEYYRYYNGTSTRAERLSKYPKKQLISVETHPQILNLADTIWSCLYKRSFLKENDILFQETPGASFQDISFALLVWIHAKNVYFIDEAVLHYRIDNPNSSMKNPTKIFCVFDEYRRIEEVLKNIKNKPEVLEQYFVATKYRDYLTHYRRVASQFQYALLMRLREELLSDIGDERLVENAFETNVWNEIQSILSNVNVFYEKTVKDVRDIRLEFCSLNKSVYIEAWINKLKEYENVVIYGAGQIGKKLFHFLKKNSVTVSAFLVTNLDGENMICEGVSIEEIQRVEDDESCALIIAVAEKNQYEMYEKAKSCGYKNIYRVDDIIKFYL